MATNDWLGLMQRTKQAYKPTFGQTVLQPMGQAFSQGMAGKQIAQEELKKAIFTALLGKNTPMVGEEPATMEQMMGAMKGKPGVIPSLFGAKPPEELTWKPLPVEYKPTTEAEAIRLKEAGAKWNIKKTATDYLAKNKPIPGFTIEETKELAGVEPEKEKVDIKQKALDALAKNVPLPGMTMEETKKAAGVYIVPEKPKTVTNAISLLKTYTGYEKEDLEKLGVLGQVKAARDIINSQPEYAKRIAEDVDAYFDEMLEKYKGNEEKALKKVRKYMELLGITEETITPYMKER